MPYIPQDPGFAILTTARTEVDISTRVFLGFFLPLLAVALAYPCLRTIIRRRRRRSRNPNRQPSSPTQPPYMRDTPYVYALPNTIVVPTVRHRAEPPQQSPGLYHLLLTDLFAPPRSSKAFDATSLASFQVAEKEAQSPCPICLDPLSEQLVSAGKCKHLMHTACLKGWLAKDVNAACPICRAPYEEDDSSQDSEQPS